MSLPEEEPIRELGSSCENGDIVFKDVSFRYHPADKFSVQKLNLTIPKGKVTILAGRSGSGKTTVLRLLQKAYLPIEGNITVGGKDLSQVSVEDWRAQSGMLLMEGHILRASLLDNIVLFEKEYDKVRLRQAIEICLLDEVLQLMPGGINTLIGENGFGLSQGQRQRVLLARAVYKNAEYLFLDEPTNAMDIRTEAIVLERLFDAFKGKTIVIAAHRQQTIQYADSLVVMESGRVVADGLEGVFI